MRIYIVPIKFDNVKLLEKIALSLEQVFKISTKILPLEINVKNGWSYEREQMNSTWLLSQLLQNAPNDKSKILGITIYDLYIPILTYLFGEAELKGRAAVFSLYRFQDDLYGLPVDKKKIEKRMLKEAIHELGHTFGMVHCINYDCVMHASTYIEEFDYKTSNFCKSCNSDLMALLRD